MSNALLPLQLGDVWLAVHASHVQEILGSRTWIAIPGAPSHLPGVLAWRGRAVAVLDLGTLSGIATPLTPGASRDRTVVVTVGTNTMAIPVNGVHEVQEVDDEKIRPAHATKQRFSTLEAELQGLLVPILDMPQVVQAVAGAPAPQTGAADAT
jgi:chemotaxis signal transduction protein